jgi:pyruvate dehydrogenase E2 component (dihydrolipoamide acetyltransferase)
LAVEIVMPRLSDSMEEGTILRWLVAEGDHVEPGQPLVEVETDKATVTHEADAAGLILALTVGEGASVPVGSPIAVIGEAGEELPAAHAPDAIAAAGAREAAPVQPAGAGSLGARERAPASVGAARAWAGAARAGASAAAAPSAPAAAAAPPPHSPRHPAARAKASPLARRIAGELGVDLAGLPGSGPQGRVIRADVERAAAAANGGAEVAGTAPASTPARVSPPPSGATTSIKGEPTRHELTRLQRTVARRMTESRATVPDIELRSEVDMSEAVALRTRLRDLTDSPPSLNDFIVKAAALALREFPRVNGAYRDAAFETYARVNVGIAVAAEDALVVPTVFDADTKSLGEISRTARSLAERARDGSITPADLDGGTFTVSNLGMYGIDSFSAVINPPQAAILAVGSLRPRPVVTDAGAIEARPTVVLTLACDHRIIYGVDGARFLARVRELLESPLALLL